MVNMFPDATSALSKGASDISGAAGDILEKVPHAGNLLEKVPHAGNLPTPF